MTYKHLTKLIKENTDKSTFDLTFLIVKSKVLFAVGNGASNVSAMLSSIMSRLYMYKGISNAELPLDLKLHSVSPTRLLKIGDGNFKLHRNLNFEKITNVIPSSKPTSNTVFYGSAEYIHKVKKQCNKLIFALLFSFSNFDLSGSYKVKDYLLFREKEAKSFYGASRCVAVKLAKISPNFAQIT